MANLNNTKTYEPLNPGNYVVALDRVMDKTGKTGSKYKELTFKVQEGENKGRLIFNTRFFYDGVSPKSIQISNEQANKLLKALGENGGLESVGDDLSALENYVGNPIVARVDVRDEGEYGIKNIIRSFQRR